MRKALRGAIGTLLASGVLGLTRPVAAQTPSCPPWSTPASVRKVQYEEPIVLSDGHNRLEAMKVQLALLADITTFPYYLGANVSGENLQLRGFVPNDMVRRRALDLARHATFLNVIDGLKIQANLSTRPPLRPAEAVQKDGAELLAKNFGKAGQQMHVEARPNGLVVVTGSVESVEDKLAVSKLFRQVSGCFGVLNKLTVPPVVRDGQRVVPVTRNGAVTVPPSALESGGEHVLAAPATPQLTPVVPPSNTKRMLPAPKPTMPAPKPVPPRSLDARDGELRLPPPKPSSSLPNSSGKKPQNTAAMKPPAPLMKWGQSSDPILGAETKKKPATQPETPKATPSTSKAAKRETPKAAPPTSKTASPTRKATAAHSLDAQDGELRLPTVVPSKPHNAPPTSFDKTKHAEAVKPPAPVMKWGQSAMRWESESKQKKTTAAKTEAAKVPVVKSATFTQGPDLAADKEKATTKPAAKTPAKVPIVKSATFTRGPDLAVEKANKEKPATKPDTKADAAKVPVVKSATFTQGPERTAEKAKSAAKPDAKTETPKVPVVKSATFTRGSEPVAKPAKKGKPESFASAQSSSSAGSGSTPASSAALTAPLPPMRWKRPATREESEPRTAAPKKPAPPPPASAARPATAGRAMPPATAASATPPAVRLDRPSLWPPAYDIRPAEGAKGQPNAVVLEHEEPAPKIAAAAPPPRRGKHPGVSEESEPRATTPSKPAPPPPPAPVVQPAIASRATPLPPPAPVAPPATPARVTLPTAPKMPAPLPATPPATTSRATPPAVSPDRPSPAPSVPNMQPLDVDKGSPAVITFDDDGPAPTAAPARANHPRPIVPSNLKQQIKTVCGRQARDVFVEMQHDGNVLVTVKAANASNGDTLTRKIMAIPEMASPNVRLRVAIVP